MTRPLSLVADIGGTNTRVALAEGTMVRQDSIAKFRNADFPGLEPILRQYLAGAGIAAVDGTCVAAAGPVRDGVAEMTNLSWVIDGAQLTRATGAHRVAILNDLQAQGHALGHIAGESLRPLVAGRQKPGGDMLVVGVGTGFNAAPVHDRGKMRIVPPSECGHVNMPIRTETDLRLAHFVERAHGFPGVEDVLSGRGLERLYAFAAAEAGEEARHSAAEIPPAIAAGDPVAVAAGALFARLLGTVVGNLALTHLPFGGIFLIGGVARAMLPAMETGAFAAGFHDKGRFAEFMQDFAVLVVEDDYAALTGCAAALASS